MRTERDQVKTVIITLGMIGAFTACVWAPLRWNLRSVNAEAAQLDQQMQQDREATVGSDALAHEVLTMQKQIDEAPRNVPVTAELASILQAWDIELNRQRVADKEVQTREQTPGDDFNLIPIELRFRGSFDAFYGFLQHVETMPQLMRVADLKIEGRPADPHELLQVTLQVCTFSAPESADGGDL